MARQPSVFDIKQHDSLPFFEVEIIDRSTGEPYDLTDISYVRFRMFDDSDERDPKVDAAASVVEPPTDGVIRYSFVDDDTDTDGTYLAELRLVWNDGDALTVPVGFTHIRVHPDLDNA